ncbi:MAG: error-prone DNA polymerase [Wenzhouxiangellaceae bacterium]|nr:error-prone DNA polymerase [Wenzhouxiangellaceae bacterium]
MNSKSGGITHDYAELHALSNFSFRRSASSPGEMVRQAAALGYRAIAITDECSMAGIVRAWEAARECAIQLIVGCEMRTGDQLQVVLLAPDPGAYEQICQLITRARRRAAKGRYQLERGDLEHGLDRVLAIWKPGLSPSKADAEWLKVRFEKRLWIGATRLLKPGEKQHFEQLQALGQSLALPCLACGDARMHVRSRRALMDVMSALEAHLPLSECGLRLAANGEKHLRRIETLARLYPPEWLAETVRVAESCTFTPASLNYRYPAELVPPPYTPPRWLRQLTLQGMEKRFPRGAPDPVRALVARELKLIEEMGVEAFFLTVHDIVRFARSRGILCQGRGSAANSAVCYCLGITEVDPAQQQLLFERFISKERDEPPDIDVDFEHERREEVLQYIYQKYGRERAALAATVICYRPKSALKDVGRALGLDHQRMNRLTASLAWWDQPDAWSERLEQCGFEPHSPVIRQLLALTGELIGTPRHLSQHVGGMVISDQPLHQLVPVENAAMTDRTIIQWDKDDLETLGLLKVDCLSLGMLTALRKAMDLVNRWQLENRADLGNNPGNDLGDDPDIVPATAQGNTQRATPNAHERHRSGQYRRSDSDAAWAVRDGSPAITHGHGLAPTGSDDGADPAPTLSLSSIPREDPETYAMLSRGDAVGVFQVESRAQMAMLPRLKPRCFQDLVVEVAIVRPGPIQGEMVHPYLERREHPEKVSYPSEALKKVLQRTLGVPIFQEQVMQIAIVAAGFTPGQADQLRRAMAAWKRRGGLEPFRDRLVDGMLARGYTTEFAERIYSQICGFGDYGFPESHAASFALLTYFSAWLKRHHPAAFSCGLLNSQPMGFYAPAQLVNDARRHAVAVLPIDVRYSHWDCALEKSGRKKSEPEKSGRENPAQARTACATTAGNSRRPSQEDCGQEKIDERLRLHDQPPITMPAIRLGLRMIKGLGREASRRISKARRQAPFADIQDLAERAGLDSASIKALTEAGALKALAGHRRRARWQAMGARHQGDLLADSRISERQPQLPLPSNRDDLVADYASTGLSLDQHPIRLLRARLGRRVLSARQLSTSPDGRSVEVAGLVTHRQRPGTASGVIFLSMEDETGIINVIVWPALAERYRAEVLQGQMLKVRGKLQNANGSQHVIAAHLESIDAWLDPIDAGSRDFC